MWDSDSLMLRTTSQTSVALQVVDKPGAALLVTDNVYDPITPAPHPASAIEVVGSPVQGTSSSPVVEDALPGASKVRAPVKAQFSPHALSVVIATICLLFLHLLGVACMGK